MSDDPRLDALLDQFAAPRATPELVDRIVALAPAGRAVRRWAGWMLPAALGAGLAAASVAGIFTGVQLSHAVSDTDATIAAIAGDDTSSTWPEDAA